MVLEFEETLNKQLIFFLMPTLVSTSIFYIYECDGLGVSFFD